VFIHNTLQTVEFFDDFLLFRFDGAVSVQGIENLPGIAVELLF